MIDTNTVTDTSVVSRAQKKVDAKLVFLVSKGARRAFGTMPLEFPLNDPATGRRAVDFDKKDSDGNVLEQIRYPKLEWGSTGIVSFDPNNLDDCLMLERVREWLADGRDKRITKYGIGLVENGNVEPEPFPRYETIKGSSVVDMLPNFLGDDEAENIEFLEQCARYELQMDKPRAEVLDALDALGAGAGDESGDDAVEEV